MLSANRGKTAGLLPSVLGALVVGSTTIAAHAQTTPPATPATPTSAPVTASAPITFNAMIDGYYEYNFNKPIIPAGGSSAGHIQYRNFDISDNAFTLGLAELGVSKAATDASRLGFTVKLGYGQTPSEITGSADGNSLNVLQAYGTFLIPVGAKDLTVNVGKFVTHMGYEVIEPELNYNYSRSDLFTIFIPYYAAGVSASYPLSPTVTATGFVENGWNNATYDNNVSKAFGFSLAFAPSPKWSLTLNGLASSEPDSYGTTVGTSQDESAQSGLTFNRAKNTVEPILTYNFTPAFSATVDANFDFGKGATPDAPTDLNGTWNASGVAGYLHYAMASGSSVTLRGETFDDNKGYLTGSDALKGSEFTLTYGIKSPLFSGAETRFEYRYDSLKDKAGDSLFTSSHSAKKSQNTLSISELLTF